MVQQNQFSRKPEDENLKQGRVSDSPTEALESGEPSIVQRPLGHGQEDPVNSKVNPDQSQPAGGSGRGS